MGYSCSAAAAKTEKEISERCYRESGSSNSYKVGKLWYFYEVDRTEHEDGAITGTVHEMVGTGSRKVASFKIDADGTIVNFPHLPDALRPQRRLHEIAREIGADWKSMYFGAAPYHRAMLSLDTIRDTYGADDARGIVAYFLSNAKAWRGDTAKRVKAELNSMLKAKTPRADGFRFGGFINNPDNPTR